MITEEQVLVAIKKGWGIDGDKPIGLDENFKSLGLDSIDIFNVLTEIEEFTGSKIPDDDVDKLTTARAIIDYFSSEV